MAITTVNLTDPISTLVTKVNTISGDVGDVSDLTTGDSNLVDAINTLRIDAFGDLIDSFNSLIFNLDSDLSNIDVTVQSRNALTGVNSGTGFGALSYDSATGVFTFAKVTSANIRGQVSVTDAGGDGSLSYNSATGVLTYTGPSAAEVRAHLSAGEGIDFASGVISGEDASTTNKGIASFNSSDFSVSSGVVSLAKDPVITISGDASGSGTMTNLGSTTISISLANNSVGAAEIASGAVGADELATNAVTQVKIADDAVGSAELKDVVTLIIYNSSGTPIKTLYGAGS